VHNLSTDTNWN